MTVDVDHQSMEDRIAAALGHRDYAWLSHAAGIPISTLNGYRRKGFVKTEAVIAIDGCLGPSYGDALGKLGQRLPVYVYFQRQTWLRDFDGFAKAFAGRGVLEEVKGLTGNPHEAIVPVALGRALGSLAVA